MQWANKINTIKNEQVDVRCKIYKMSYLNFILECFWHEQIHGSWRNSSKRSAASAPRLKGRHSILLLNLNDFSKDKFLRILKLLKGLLSEVTVCLLIFFLWIHGAVNKVINFSTMKTISNISSNNVKSFMRRIAITEQFVLKYCYRELSILCQIIHSSLSTWSVMCF